MTEKSLTKIIAIVGPTASGKTKLAIELAKKIDTEIISADSRLVYKGFDIASAKPTIEERQGIKHHLIDVVEPEFDYTVANYCEDAKKIINELTQKGKTPIIVGGTGLYFRILLEDYAPPQVAPNPELRKKLEKLSEEEVYQELLNKDPQAAATIHSNNKVRAIRFLEIIESTGLPIAKAQGKKDTPEFDVEWIGLNPLNRADLYKRIDDRVLEMVKLGVLEETKSLLEKHGRIKNFVGTIGYKEILEYLDGDATLDEAIAKIQQNSRRYAKRQLTWFRRNEKITWFKKPEDFFNQYK